MTSLNIIPATRPPVERLRELASAGDLVAAVQAAEPAELTQLTGAAFDVAWPVVYTRLTRRLERRRGHRTCGSSAQRLADDCLDRFYDDVESVIQDLFRNASLPIQDLEGWIASRLNASTVDGHRRRRGDRGALQRPRLPGWLAVALGSDRWLTTLGTELLVWVGLPVTAGTGTWPLESWAQLRASITGDHTGSTPSQVTYDVDRVLAAMRQRPLWYARYVETPLGRKQPPVATLPPDSEHQVEQEALPLTHRHEFEDARLRELAAAAMAAIAGRIGRGEEPRPVVLSVLQAAFGRSPAGQDLDRPPHAGLDHQEWVAQLLADPGAVDRLVDRVLGIVTAGR